MSFAFLFAFSPPANAVNISSNAGTTTGQFLKVEMGARHAAMGGTYAAYGSDAFSVWGQPAAIAVAPAAWQVGFQHAELFQAITQEYLGVTGGLGSRSKIGLVINTLGVSDLQRATENGLGQFGASSGTFGARDIAVALHYGYEFEGNIAVGGAARYISSEIDNVRANGFAGDIGIRASLHSIEGLTFGASVTNIGTGLKFLNARDEFPTTFRGGAAYQLQGVHVLLAADVVKALDRNVDAGVGLEWRPVEMLALRAGYRSQGRDAGKGLTAGVGINFSGLDIDYAYVPFGPLGDAHRISAGYIFGSSKSESRNPK